MPKRLTNRTNQAVTKLRINRPMPLAPQERNSPEDMWVAYILKPAMSPQASLLHGLWGPE
jgi:hypothetical protein